MAYGFNTDKTKNENIITFPDFSYTSKDSQYDFSLAANVLYHNYYDSHDIIKKGWYYLEFTAHLKSNLNVLLSIGTTDFPYDTSNTDKFYHLVSESGDQDKFIIYKFFIPFNVGDRIGIFRGSITSPEDILYLSAKYIPLK